MALKSFSFIAAAVVVAVVLGVNAASAAATGSLMISQVLYSPAGTNSGGEAVELYNPTANSATITGWVLATETSPTDAVLPEGAVICGGCHYLIADSGWAAAKDNTSWPNADFEEPITLANTDAGVALKDPSGVTIDAVGWGNPANIGTGLFEGTPHSGASGNNALRRRLVNGSYADTGDNSNDFLDSIPEFHNSSTTSSSSASNAEIRVTIVVSGSTPVISLLSILGDDDTLLPGVQLSPVPKSNRTVTVEAVVSDANGVSDISSVVFSFSSSTAAMTKKNDINATAATYSATISLPSSFPAGNYTITAAANDSAGFSSNTSTSFEYLTLIAFEAEPGSLVLLATPGLPYEPGEDSATNITLLNSGNVKLDFEIWSSNFTSQNSVIEPSGLQYAFKGNYSDQSASGNLTGTRIRKDVNLNAEARTGLSLRMRLPRSTSPGNYSGIISLVAVDSG